MQKIKEFSKKYLFGFVLGMLTAGVVVYAATYFPSNQTTYDNSDSGMTSTNVQDAVDELYEVCKPTLAEEIIKNAGLEKDPYECRYFFTGADPNNYITFNNETAGWRIISAECDGTIKIISRNDVGGGYWENLNHIEEVLQNTDLTANAKNQIVSHDWNAGTVTDNNNDLAGQINDENSSKWSNQKIGLITVSEFLRTHSDKNNCQTVRKYNYYSCYQTSWLGSDETYTINRSSGYSSVYLINRGLKTTFTDDDGYGNPLQTHDFLPVVYLSSSVQITGGDGSENNPYQIQ